jgi:mono/diheme cytochrome c family protein
MKVLIAIGTAAVVTAIGAAGWFMGGFYNVAGTAEDPDIVRWALIQVRTASVSRHATQAPPTDFSDEGKVTAGARAFAARGCANCHGAPGVTAARFSEGLRPYPADLNEVGGDRSPSELFWVIKNGINMTGMPSFGLAGVKDKEIWSMVAFLKSLPTVSESEYKTWTAPALVNDQPSAASRKPEN